MRTRKLVVLTAFIVMAAGCDPASPDASILAPDAPERRSVRAANGGFACPTAFDHVATDQASLLAAVAAAAPGDVIGIDGFFPLTQPVEVTAAGVTVTCVSPGSGLANDPSANLGFLLATAVDDVTIEGLRLDATNGSWPVYTVFNEGFRLAHNDVVCGWSGCGFIVGVTNAVVTDNAMESWGSSSGLHMQGGIDGARVLRNTITAHAPSWHPVFGGIRAREGADVLLKNNVVTGPWQSSIASADIRDGEYAENELGGAVMYGVALDLPGTAGAIPVTGTVFRGNRIGDAGWGGILARSSCGNELVNNRISGSPGIHLAESSGDNHMRATFGSVIDDGAYDCDGDGTIDANRVSGKVGHGGHVPAADAALKTPDAGSTLPAMQ